MVSLDLRLDDAELSSCVACGLCLPHCPTFRVTGEEALSPRGRIDAMRAVQWRGADADADFVRFMDTCVQCRGCEPACPSGVPFGHLMEGTRNVLAAERATAPRWLRAGLGVLPRHRLLLAGSTALAVAQRLRLVPRRAGLARLPLRRPPPIRATARDVALTAGGPLGRRRSPVDHRSTSGRQGAEAAAGPIVWLFTGCVMDAWLRPTHHATAELIAMAGATFAVPDRDGACCGALHAHAGLHTDAVRLAERVMRSMPGDSPILVNSAGCGAAMKDYGHLAGTAEAKAFSARVLDVHEWLAERLKELTPAPTTRPVVIVQDPCHLRHVQRSHLPVRAVLGHVADVVELDDDGLCCGAGGAYSAVQPELAAKIRERKVAVIRTAAQRSGATIVASANPGCAMHLAAQLGGLGLTVRHPVDIVADALRGS